MGESFSGENPRVDNTLPEGLGAGAGAGTEREDGAEEAT
jgi:hypothetical protein